MKSFTVSFRQRVRGQLSFLHIYQLCLLPRFIRPYSRTHFALPSHSGRSIEQKVCTYSSSARGGPSAAQQSLRNQGQSFHDSTEDPNSLWDSYNANKVTEILFKECARQADYIIPQAFERSGTIPKNEQGEDIGEGTGYWYEDIGLTPTFSNWAHVTMLHMYLFTVRLRYLPPEHAERWMQLINDQFFYEAEHRMNIFHNISSRAARNRYLKDLYNQWRGVQGAYDEGLVKGDAVLGAAVWRNIFKANQDVDWKKVALIVSFIRRGLRGLDRVKDKTILTGSLQFGNPIEEVQIVERLSEGIKEEFLEAEDA